MLSILVPWTSRCTGSSMADWCMIMFLNIERVLKADLNGFFCRSTTASALDWRALWRWRLSSPTLPLLLSRDGRVVLATPTLCASCLFRLTMLILSCSHWAQIKRGKSKLNIWMCVRDLLAAVLFFLFLLVWETKTSVILYDTVFCPSSKYNQLKPKWLKIFGLESAVIIKFFCILILVGREMFHVASAHFPRPRLWAERQRARKWDETTSLELQTSR